jgi:2'-5' RNA ligase
MPTRTDSPARKDSAKYPATLRVFFAFWPDASAHDRIAAAARDVVRRAGGRAPPPENHHLTVAFVGDLASERLAALQRVGATAARAVAPFVLALDRLGAFHHMGIAWLGTDDVPPELSHLVGALRDGLAANAFPVERRRFRAHVTLARRCGPLATAAIAPVAWRVERMTLNASQLLPAGSIYRELAAWPLG